MTADELEKSVAIELFRTDDPEGYQQYDAGILVSFPDVYKELARMAIRVCMEAAMNGFQALKPEELITAEMAIDHLIALIPEEEQ